MNVASLELCEELYELSGWLGENEQPPTYQGEEWQAYGYIPAYDLGYLLRKLPAGTNLFKYCDTWAVMSSGAEPETWRADTPENAAAKFAIELFKQGVLKEDNLDE